MPCSRKDGDVAVFTGAALLERGGGVRGRPCPNGRCDVEHRADPEAGPPPAAMLRRLAGSLRRLAALPADCALLPAYAGIHFAGASVEPRWANPLRVTWDSPASGAGPRGRRRSGGWRWVAAAAGADWGSFPSSFRDLYRANAV
eukprot:gene6695-21177_t